MLSFTNLLVVMAIAFAAPLLLGLFPRVQLPSVVLEIVAGIVVGPSVLGIVEVDEAVQVVALLGLAFVLFLAGLEIEFEKLRGQVLRITLGECERGSAPRSPCRFPWMPAGLVPCVWRGQVRGCLGVRRSANSKEPCWTRIGRVL